MRVKKVIYYILGEAQRGDATNHNDDVGQSRAAPTKTVPHKRYPGKGSSKGGPFTMRMKVEHLITPKQEKPAEPFDVDRFIRELYQMDPELIFRGKVLLDQRKVIDLAKRHKDRCVLQVEDMEKSKG